MTPFPLPDQPHLRAGSVTCHHAAYLEVKHGRGREEYGEDMAGTDCRPAEQQTADPRLVPGEWLS